MSEIDGQTYAIFIQDAQGAKQPMHVSDRKWNVSASKMVSTKEGQ